MKIEKVTHKRSTGSIRIDYRDTRNRRCRLVITPDSILRNHRASLKRGDVLIIERMFDGRKRLLKTYDAVRRLAWLDRVYFGSSYEKLIRTPKGG